MEQQRGANAAWSALFFRRHALKVSTIETVALAASTGILAARAWNADRVSGARDRVRPVLSAYAPPSGEAVAARSFLRA